MSPKRCWKWPGVRAAPPRLAESTIVVIDAQHEYLDGALVLPGVATALEEIGRLLERARAQRAPVIHIVHHGKAGGLFAPGSPGAEIAAPAAPRPARRSSPRACPTPSPAPISPTVSMH